MGEAIETTTATTLARIGAAHRSAVRAEWAAAEAAGLPLIVVDDGTLLLGATTSLESHSFNRALGLTEHPTLLDTALGFFAEHGVEGTVVLDPSDAPRRVTPLVSLDVHVGAAADSAPNLVDGLDIRILDVTDGPGVASWMRILIEANVPPADIAPIWRRMAPFMVATPGWVHLQGSMAGEMVAAGSLFVTEGVGWQSWASVVPVARGRGIQRALIDARSRLAVERGCDLVAAWALAGAHSSANLERAGLARIGRRVVLRSSDLR